MSSPPPPVVDVVADPVLASLHAEHDHRRQFDLFEPSNGRDYRTDFHGSAETRWASRMAQKKQLAVDKKTTGAITDATLNVSITTNSIKDEISEIDNLLSAIGVRENELRTMKDSLDEMCLTLTSRNLDRKKMRLETARTAGSNPSSTAVELLDYSALSAHTAEAPSHGQSASEHSSRSIHRL